MSQEHNVRLVEVAATMVGVRVLPRLEEGEPDIPEAVLRGRLPELTGGVRRVEQAARPA